MSLCSCAVPEHSVETHVKAQGEARTQRRNPCKGTRRSYSGNDKEMDLAVHTWNPDILTQKFEVSLGYRHSKTLSEKEKKYNLICFKSIL